MSWYELVLDINGKCFKGRRFLLVEKGRMYVG